MTKHEVERLAFCIVQGGGICPTCDQVIEEVVGLSLHQVAYDHAADCLKEEEKRKYGPPK